MEEIDVWRTAQLLIRQHGESAGRGKPRGLAVGKGDLEGERVWAEILKAIKTLLETKASGPLN